MFLASYCLLFEDYEKLFADFNYKSKYSYFRTGKHWAPSNISLFNSAS